MREACWRYRSQFVICRHGLAPGLDGSSPECASAIDLISRDESRRGSTQGSDLSESSCESDSNEEGCNKELFSGELFYSYSQVYTDKYVLSILKVKKVSCRLGMHGPCHLYYAAR